MVTRRPYLCAILLTATVFVAGAASAPGQQLDSVTPKPCEALGWLSIPELAGPASEFARAAETTMPGATTPGAVPPRTHLLRRPFSHTRQTLCDEPEMPWRHRLVTREASRAGLVISARPLSMSHHLNTGYPDDRNNGALWAGRGWNSAVNAGFEVRWGVLSAAVEPVVTYQENRAFQIATVRQPGFSRMIYPGHPTFIDWPQRFGEASFWTVHPGQSTVRLDVKGVAAGISTENLWWGPALKNPLLLSNTAPGFPHVFLRTSTPFDVGIGHLEAEMIWGRLRQSAYFTPDAGLSQRLAGGAILALRPKVPNGLSLGAARMHISQVPPDGLTVPDAILRPYGGGESATAALEMTTVFARWVLSQSGFEIFGEFALPDYDWDSGTAESQAAASRDRAAAYVVGAVKVFPFDPGWLRLYTELFRAQNVLSLANNLPTQTYYIHPEVRQGYTHAGQLLGAGVGPGAEAQVIGVDFYGRWGSVGLVAERVGYDDDAYYNQHVNRFGFHGFDVEVSVGVRQTLFLGPIDLHWQLNGAQRRNRNFINLAPGFRPVDRNWTFSVGSSWSP